MFEVTRRHVDRTRTHLLARTEWPIVGGRRNVAGPPVGEVYVQVKGETQAYVLSMSRDDALALAARLTKIVDDTRADHDWHYVE